LTLDGGLGAEHGVEGEVGEVEDGKQQGRARREGEARRNRARWVACGAGERGASQTKATRRGHDVATPQPTPIHGGVGHKKHKKAQKQRVRCN
jgi:hypothetical protein